MALLGCTKDLETRFGKNTLAYRSGVALLLFELNLVIYSHAKLSSAENLVMYLENKNLAFLGLFKKLILIEAGGWKSVMLALLGCSF